MKTSLSIFLTVLIGSLSQSAFSQNEKHEDWKSERESELQAEDGWLNLAGLFWLDSGANYLNFKNQDQLSLSKTSGNFDLGTFKVEHGKVTFFSAKNSIVNHQETRIQEFIQFPDEHNGSLNSGQWKWTVIERGGKFAVRLRDLKHPALSAFQKIPYFEYDPNWDLEAFFEPKFNQTISITNVLGQSIEWIVMGILHFEVNGQKQELVALEDEGKLFVLFSDLTNDQGTYPSGRFLYVNYPDNKGVTRIDFNYSINPPCAFTSFAVCPIPPKSNRLEMAVKAGEKLSDNHFD